MNQSIPKPPIMPRSTGVFCLATLVGWSIVMDVSAQLSPSQIRANQAEARLRESEQQNERERKLRLEAQAQLEDLRRSAMEKFERQRLDAVSLLQEHRRVASELQAERERRAAAEDTVSRLHQQSGGSDSRNAEPRSLRNSSVADSVGEELQLDVKGFVLDANAPERLKTALPDLVAPHLGKNKTVGDLSKVTRDVNQYLKAELGYFTAYAYFPEQDMQQGLVRIAVLEGRLEGVELVGSWPPNILARKELVLYYLSQLTPGQALLTRDLERVAFRINELEGVRAAFEIQPGSEIGAIRLLVHVSA